MARKGIDPRLIHEYRKARAHQLETYSRDNVWFNGVRTHEHTGGGAVYGHHAQSAIMAARHAVHFLERYRTYAAKAFQRMTERRDQ